MGMGNDAKRHDCDVKFKSQPISLSLVAVDRPSLQVKGAAWWFKLFARRDDVGGIAPRFKISSLAGLHPPRCSDPAPIQRITTLPEPPTGSSTAGLQDSAKDFSHHHC